MKQEYLGCPLLYNNANINIIADDLLSNPATAIQFNCSRFYYFLYKVGQSSYNVYQNGEA